MELLSHQTKTIERVVAKCQKQKGLVMYHGMGTGKTLTSLGIIMNYENNKSVIFCPSHLNYTWKKEMEKVNHDFKNTDIMSHEDLYSYTDFKDKIVIIDEAHNIVDTMRTYMQSKENNSKSKSKRSFDLVGKIQESKKILLLTGTPIYNDISDLSLLINIAAGKQIITYNKTDFVKRYMNISKSTSMLHGYIFPFLKSKPYKFFGMYTSIIMALPQYLPKTMISYIKSINPQFLFSASEMTDIYNKLFRLKLGVTEGFTQDAIRHLSVPATLIILKIIATIGDRYKLENLYTMKFDTFTKDISPFIDFYKPIKGSGFPTKKMETKMVEYNSHQIEEWLKLTYQMQTQDSNKMNENEKTDQHSAFFAVTPDNYLDIGRTIGNLRINDVDSPKFTSILAYMKQNPGNHLIYSNFYNKGGLLLSDFFTRHKVKHVVLQPKLKKEEIDTILNNFKSQKINVLILHQKYTEGLSVPSTKYFHIIEPVLNFSKYDQTIGRALRTDSHSHLPQNERHVTIINWICTNKSFKNGILNKVKELKVWKDHFNKVYFDKFKASQTITDPLTPDQIISNLNDGIISMKENIQKMLQNQNKKGSQGGQGGPCATGENTIKCQITTLQKKGDCNTQV